ncbi:DUF1353 domain-containing protein [Parafrigoribacterium humi]|uniref:DUF1353 domain-containing protein n=1 Tax=Parafrigoribacterium humi TaxID=3144664 RepID=UPI0032EED5F8
MPFYDEQGAPLDRIYLVQRSPRHFQLLRPISFLEAGRPESQRVEVPAHDPDLPAVGDNQTDLASVPPFLWGLVASYGRQSAAALLHDHLSDEARRGDPATRIRRRREADRLFGVALLDSGISILRMLIMRSFVSVQKYVEFRRWQASAMIAHAVLAIAAVYAVIGAVAGLWTTPLGSSPWVLLFVLLPAVTTVAWGRDTVTMIVVVYAGAIFAPFILAAFIAQFFLLLVEGVVWLLAGRRSPVPVLGPTILARHRP